MRPIKITCKFINVTERIDGKMGSTIVLEEPISHKVHRIIVDESVDRVKTRLSEQLKDDPRDGVFLSRGITNININTHGDVWDINQEDLNWYSFWRQDVLNFVNNFKGRFYRYVD